MSLEIPLIQN